MRIEWEEGGGEGEEVAVIDSNDIFAPRATGEGVIDILGHEVHLCRRSIDSPGR